MIYYSDDQISIRTILETDAKTICDQEIEQGWHATEDKYKTRISDNESGKAIALVAEYEGNVAGYINVYNHAICLNNKYYCSIVDFGVLEKYRNHGIGTKLMDVAEKIASDYADTVFLDVGLHSGYGSAQRMYVKRGYIPDGKGVWYGKEIGKPYETYCNDDDLNLHFSKKLR